MVKLALIQMRIEPGARADNLRHAALLVAEAAAKGANIVLLPETLTTGWTDASFSSLADAVPHGGTCTVLGKLAETHKIHLCAGLVERADEAIYNAAVLIGPDGRVCLHHHKIHELKIAHQCYAQRDRLAVANTSVGRIGVMIRADAFAPGQVISRTLGLMGADIILSPCAWAVPRQHDNAREPYGQLWRDNSDPVARDFGMWIAGGSNVGPITSGPWAGRKCIGCSILVGPDGKVILQGRYGENAETTLYADVELKLRQRDG